MGFSSDQEEALQKRTSPQCSQAWHGEVRAPGPLCAGVPSSEASLELGKLSSGCVIMEYLRLKPSFEAPRALCSFQ